MGKGFDNLENIKILEKNDDSVSLTFTVPKENAYYDGHFPGNPILPAVAQMEIIVRFADQFFGTGIFVSRIKRMKFNKIITPGLPLLLRIDKKDNAISYTFSSPDENDTYSSGTFSFHKNGL